MNRRALLVGASTFAISHARAQPMPIIGPVGGPQQGGGPLWSFPTVPPGATLDLSFLVSGTMPPLITFTRASTATYFDATGTMQTAAVNTPRWDYDPVTLALRGLLLEDQRTNLLLNSATLGTQSVTVTAQLYTLSFYGTGTITKSGTASGALVGTGAFPTRVSQSFTPTAGTLTLTVTGSVLNAQLEATQDSPTSYIPTTGTAVTRAIDSCLIPPANMTPWFAPPGGSWFAEFDYFNANPGGGIRIIGRTAAPGSVSPVYIANTPGVANQFDGATAVQTANTTLANTNTKIATSWASASARVCMNGGAITTSALLATGYGVLATSGTSIMQITALSAVNANGHIRRVRYWPRVLADAEMQQVTR